MNRILFFTHYNKYDGLSDYILYLLDHVKHIYSRIVFISNSNISETQKQNITGICDTIIVQDNKDFNLSTGWDTLEKYDSITLMDDTCFGPVFDMEAVYVNMENQDIDFWGLTNQRKIKNVPEHIQSYFMCFHKNVIQSSVFQASWNTFKFKQDEFKLFSILSASGFKSTVLFDTKIQNVSVNYNFAIQRPDLCLKNGVPFLKIESFINFPYPKYIFTFLEKNTDYPVQLIKNCFLNVHSPNTQLFLGNKLIPVNLNLTPPSSQLTITTAIHLHVFYLDVFTQYINYFDTWDFNFDIFITTDSEDKKNFIENFIKTHSSGSKIREIIIIANHGRDILPWLAIADKLKNYDIAGHFHTKNTVHSDEWEGISWQQEIFN
jgi:rhamnosyltransferase